MIFWLLLPLALVSMVGGQLYIRNQVVSRQEKFDAPALILLGLTLFTIIYALSLIGSSNLAWILLLAGVILFALFIFVNKSGDNHLLNLSIFKEKTGCLAALTGIGRALKKAGDVKVYALEPAESPVLKEGKRGPHKIQGISAGFIPKNLDQSIYDGIVEVSSDDAFAMAREVARLEGFLPGISAGANIHGAIELAKKLGAGKKVVTVAPDNGERYLSTALYQ